MKFGPMEGSPKEIKDFFQDNGLRASDYLIVPEAPIRAKWFVVPGTIYAVALAVCAILSGAQGAVGKLVLVIGCGALLWLGVNVQLRFKSPWATGLTGLGGVLLMLVASGTVTPA